MKTPYDLRAGQTWVDVESDNGMYSFKILSYKNRKVKIEWLDGTAADSPFSVEDILEIFINKGVYNCIEPKSRNFNSLYEKLSGN